MLVAKIKKRVISPRLLLLAVIAVGLLASFANFSMVSSATISIEPVRVDNGQLPTADPNSAAWQKAKPIEVPMSAQQMVRPSGGSTRQVYIRALDDEKSLAIMVSWRDDTMNTVETEQESSDAVAIQWPLLVEASAPFQCMGQLDAPVNIWQWKASHQVAVENTHSDESAVYNLVSNGICKAADTPGIVPMGKGVWGDVVTPEGETVKGWNVVFSRKFSTGKAGAAQIEPGKSTNIAFAVWNGAPGLREMKSRKSVASWVTFNAASGNRIDLTWLNLLIIGLVSVVAIALTLALVPKQSKAPQQVATPNLDTTGRPLADTPAARAMAITARSKRI